MGNCLKSNKVEPFVVRNNSAEMLERGTPDRRSAKSKHADMIQDLMDEGTTPKVGKAGYSFVVDFNEDTKKGKKAKKPAKLGKKASDAGTSVAQDPDMPEYSAEEKALMVEIMRGDIIKEKIDKARHADIKIYDAKRKRMCFQAQADADSRVEQEKVLKAEAAREEKLQQQKEKARQAEMKAYDVKRKKMALDAQAEALKKQEEALEVEDLESNSDVAAASTD